MHETRPETITSPGDLAESDVDTDTQGGLLRAGVGSLVVKLLHATLTLGTTVVLARLLGPSEFGLYAFFFALITVIAIPVQSGLPVLVVRETATGKALRDWAAVAEIWRWSFRFVLTGSLVAIAVGCLVVLGGENWIGSEGRKTLTWALPLIPLMALAALHGAALRGLGRTVLGQLPDYVLRLGSLMVLLLFWQLISATMNASLAMALHVLAAAVALVVARIWLRRLGAAQFKKTLAKSPNASTWLPSILPLGFIAAAQTINTRADLLLLGLLDSTESVGVYQVAVQGAQVTALALVSIDLVIAPRCASLYASKRLAVLQRLVTISARVALLLTLPVVPILAIYGDTLIGWLFGKPYISAYWPLFVLLLGQLVNGAFGSVAMLLNMTRNERITAKALAVAAGLNILLNLMLIPRFGLVGAALATAISMTAWKTILWHASRRALGIDSFALSLSIRSRNNRAFKSR